MNGYLANPKHPLGRPASRHAVTLAEVLIAMGILTIGLLGVAAIFPVGGHYMQTGDIADRGGAIAQAALDDAIIRGHLDPDNWVVHDVSTGQGDFMALSSGEVVRTGSTLQRNGISSASTIQDMAFVDSPIATNQNFVQGYRSTAFGDAYVIDPIGLAGALWNTTATQTRDPYASSSVRHFPALGTTASTDLYASPRWKPWDSFEVSWPVRRVTTVHAMRALNSNARNLQEPLARELFSAADDLAQHFPTSGDEPVRQRWENWTPGNGDFYPSGRQSQGDYSWIISVAPSSSAARDAMATRPDAYPVEVSVVVFHKRTATRGLQATADAERLVTARVATSGPSGGELLLNRRAATNNPNGPNEPETSPFDDLRAGQYVMVVGPHPLSTDSRPILAVRWCRVLNIEDTGEPVLQGGKPILNGDQQVLVALRGADWPWQPASSLELGSNAATRAAPPLGTQLSNDLRVAILPGAVAVHTKTMRLESGSQWSID